MSMNREAREIAIVAAKFGQQCPDLSAHILATVAGKLYRLARSLEKEPYDKALVNHANRNATMLGAKFDHCVLHNEVASELRFPNNTRVVL